MRRIITGHDAEGRAHVVTDGQVEIRELPLSPGAGGARVWGSDAVPEVGAEPPPDEGGGWFPPVGGARVTLFQVPPDTAVEAAMPDTDADPEALGRMLQDALERTEADFPGLLATVDPDDPPFHATDTVDVVFLVRGDLVLDLGDEQTPVRQGDLVVQHGTRHAWRNPGDDPALLLTFSVGARRAPS